MRKGVSRLCVSGFVVRQVEKTLEKDKKVYMSFVDLEKAYDNVSRDELCNLLEEYEVKRKLLSTIQTLYEGDRACEV